MAGERAMQMSRFEALAGAYGGDSARWPPAERDAARRLAAAEPATTQRILVAARRLDELLGAAPVALPSRALRDRIVAAGPRVRASDIFRTWLGRLAVGATLAAAGAAGVAAGAVLAPAAIAHLGEGADVADAATMLLREPADPAEAG